MVSTPYEGPVVVSSFRLAGREVRVVRPGDPDRLLDDPDVLAWNRRDDYMPYWAFLWPGAVMLAEAVAREPMAAGTRALEIGCGLGLAGLVGLARGLRVAFHRLRRGRPGVRGPERPRERVRSGRILDVPAGLAPPPDDRFPRSSRPTRSMSAGSPRGRPRPGPDARARRARPDRRPNRASADGLPEALDGRGLTLQSTAVIAEVPGQGAGAGRSIGSDGRGRAPPPGKDDQPIRGREIVSRCPGPSMARLSVLAMGAERADDFADAGDADLGQGAGRSSSTVIEAVGS